MNEDAAEVPAPTQGEGGAGRQLYAPPCLTSYGSLPVDTAAGPGIHTFDFTIGYFS